jgi:hypothetical protein
LLEGGYTGNSFVSQRVESKAGISEFSEENDLSLSGFYAGTRTQVNIKYHGER